MFRAGQQILGIAIGEKTIHLAEVRGAAGAGGAGGTTQVQRCATFAVPADAGWDKPQNLGRSLGEFLRQQGFSARHAAVGLPGRWVLLRSRPMPPAAPAAAAGIL